MNNVVYVTALVMVCGLVSMARAQTTPVIQQDYQIQLFKRCQLVKQVAMTAEQIKAYQELKVQEDLMHELELPVKGIEVKMQEYGNKIEELTALAIQERDSNLHINKRVLKQQEAMVQELDKYKAIHQAEFEALGAQGHKISKMAKVFERAIKATLNNIELDQIHIITPTDKTTGTSCYADNGPM